jgi:hypothetical protein
MRTSLHRQPEAQPPNFPARRTGQPQYPIYRDPRYRGINVPNMVIATTTSKGAVP